jgi:tRNA (guanine9-N1)-methyltransferase
MKEAEEAKAKKKAALTAPNGVILDLEFGHLMQDKEMRSMAKQLTFCYSANTRAQVPVRLYLTGLGGRMGETARKACSGINNWAVIFSEESYLETLADRKKDLVYLTADSENELEDFKEDEIYIIGGIVDRNRYKNLTLNKANEQGIRHARLPIQNHLKMTGTHVSNPLSLNRFSLSPLALLPLPPLLQCHQRNCTPPNVASARCRLDRARARARGLACRVFFVTVSRRKTELTPSFGSHPTFTLYFFPRRY